MSAEGVPFRPGGPGLLLRVRVTPRSARDAVEGVETVPDGTALAVRVRAAPEDGAANEAVARLVAEWLDLPRRCVAIRSGARSRVKTLGIEGDGPALAEKARGRLRDETGRSRRKDAT